jgi:HAD superfamily hydrolase (TIGR01549 family)
MHRKILAVFLDSGDTLVDEGTQERGSDEIVLRADLIPGAAEMVQELKRRNYPLALVADGHTATFRNVLGQHGLFDLFDARAISEEVGVDKPRPEMFLAALEKLHIAPSDYRSVVMVGNHLERDIKGANSLGLISVWIDWAPRRPKQPANESEIPQYTIRNPGELLTLLDRLENEGTEKS